MSMRFARSCLVAVAAGIVLGGSAARADDARIVLVQAGEAQKRAELLQREWSSGGATVKFGAVEPGATPEGLLIKNVEITTKDNKTVRIAAVEVRGFDWVNVKEPKYLDLTVRQAVIGADLMDAEGQQNLKELGYAALTITADIAYKFDEASKAVEVSKFNLDVADAGELRFALRLSGVSPADIKGATSDPQPGTGNKPGANNEAALMGMLARINIASFSLSFKDKSLVQRAIKSEAAKKKMSEQDARAAIIAELQKEKTEAQDDVTKEFLETAAKFIANPGEITLAANPPAPVNVMGAFMMVMSNPAQLKQMLGLALTVK
jgi:hypothetical protein